MMITKRSFLLATLAIVGASPSPGLSSCLGTVFRDSFEELEQSRYEVELVISQLGARSATFQLNAGETITAEGDGTFCFTELVQGEQPYDVAITEQPAAGNVCGGDLTGTATGPISIAVSCDFNRTEWDQINWDEANWN